MLNNWREIKGLEMAKSSFSGIDSAGGKPTEENKFFMSEKQCGFPRDAGERRRRVDVRGRVCIIYSCKTDDK